MCLCLQRQELEAHERQHTPEEVVACVQYCGRALKWRQKVGILPRVPRTGATRARCDDKRQPPLQILGQMLSIEVVAWWEGYRSRVKGD